MSETEREKPLLGKLKKAEPKPTRPTNVTVDEDEVSPSLEGMHEEISDLAWQGASDEESDSDA